MRYLSVISVALILASFRGDELKLKATIPVQADYFTTDNLGNIYIMQGQEIHKYDVNFELQNKFSNKLLGEITSIDATNPLKIMLFYKGLTQVAFLDNMLGMQGAPMPLEQYGLEQAALACVSHQNGLWVYDLNTFQLILLDQDFRVSQETGDINRLLGLELEPNFLIERNNWVYLNDPATGILVFDIYGTYYKTIPIKGLKEFQILGTLLYYTSGNNLLAFDMKLLKDRRTELPDTSFKQVRIAKQNIYVLTDKELKVYAVQPQ